MIAVAVFFVKVLLNITAKENVKVISALFTFA
jgi:hypothetical protein